MPLCSLFSLCTDRPSISLSISFEKRERKNQERTMTYPYAPPGACWCTSRCMLVHLQVHVGAPPGACWSPRLKWHIGGCFLKNRLYRLPHLHPTWINVALRVADNLRLGAQRETRQHQHTGLLHRRLGLLNHRLNVLAAGFHQHGVMDGCTHQDAAFGAETTRQP